MNNNGDTQSKHRDIFSPYILIKQISLPVELTLIYNLFTIYIYIYIYIYILVFFSATIVTTFSYSYSCLVSQTFSLVIN